VSDDRWLYQALCCLLVAALGAVALLALAQRLSRKRTGLALAYALLAAFALRAVAAVGLSALGSTARTMRGPDDAAFFDAATRLADGSAGDWIDALAGNLNTAIMALQLAVLGDAGDTSLRLGQSLMEVAGIGLLAAAVYDLAGVRAALAFAWLAAIEPTNLFFSTFLHKESLSVLGGAIVVLGLAAAWRRIDLRGLLLVATGVVVLAATRRYAGVAIAGGAALALAYFVLRDRVGVRRALTVVGCVSAIAVAAGIVLGPRVAPGPIATLQAYQNYEPTSDVNLQLRPADVSTSAGLAKTLVVRTFDLVARPFPWQLGNLNQQLGALGTLLWLALLAAALVGFVRAAGRMRERTLVLLAPALPLIAVFALTLTNAALGFRHRVHIVLLVAGVAAIVWLAREPGAHEDHSENSRGRIDRPDLGPRGLRRRWRRRGRAGSVADVRAGEA
jgi:hypothetical protein